MNNKYGHAYFYVSYKRYFRALYSVISSVMIMFYVRVFPGVYGF